ncbi:CinA family protein [Rhizobium halophytocola]|uniref:Nicotinamide-nucleotide amidase n=1 Tax=Rhizobium halophytocola TaxID=735519 RepID=A0ABS4DWF8_9HYPH|nr:CinA family protein [Rhizobium halophytocola]MBP1850036.1 nicotinamide-nucleotide amidase [Rhizobium halophytocola]
MPLFPPDIEQLAEQIIRDLAARGLTLATAESCTGGLIAGALTEISGSSAVVDRGFVTYSNTAKRQMIGVDAETLERYGAVSRETALQMARGARLRAGTDIAVAVTGIAGPGGGSAQKPVGLVHLCASGRNATLIHREMRYGDLGRTGIRLATVRTALEMLREAAQAVA